MDLREISDRMEINELLARYCHALDRQDWPAYRALFTPDAKMDFAAFGGPVGLAITALTLLRQALTGWCGWVTFTRDGRLTVGRLRKRGGAVGSVRLGRGQIITVRRSNDTAPGLATRLAGLRNHTVHSDSDIATSLDDALRAELQAEYTIKTGVGSMPPAALPARPRCWSRPAWRPTA